MYELLIKLYYELEYKKFTLEDIKEFEDIDTYYEISNIVAEVFQDRVEAHKHLVTANKEIERLNNIIEEVREYLTDEGVCILNKGKKENERLVWTWENYYDLLEILKGSEKE